MSEHRTYTCLACVDRPVFHGKVGANMHLRAAHDDLLEHHHPDELLSEGPEFVPSDPPGGPFVCVFRDEDGVECGEKRPNFWGIRQHLVSSHGFEPEHVNHGVQYLSEDEYADRTRRLYDQAVHPLTPQQEWWARRFGQAAESLRGVADFLTECRA